MKKAREGVRVCMLVWDDKSSINTELLGGNGMMATHDEDTRRYFKNTGVSSLGGRMGGRCAVAWNACGHASTAWQGLHAAHAGKACL